MMETSAMKELKFVQSAFLLTILKAIASYLPTSLELSVGLLLTTRTLFSTNFKVCLCTDQKMILWKYFEVLRASDFQKQSVTRRCSVNKVFLTQFRMGIFGAAHGWGEEKGLLPKICHIYLTMMKLRTVIPYLKKTQKNIQMTWHVS